MATEKLILLVDDDPTSLKILEKLLASNHFSLLCAENGAEALNLITQHKPDLIITDTLMPQVSGFELVEKIRTLDAPLNEIPIIVTSAKKNMGSVFLGSDIQAFIAKPIDSNILMSHINDLFLADTEVIQNPIQPPSAPEKPVESAKTVILAGVQDFILNKVKEYLKTKGYLPILAHDEEDAVDQAKETKPLLVLVQYWDKPEQFDAERIYVSLKANPESSNIRYLAFRTEGLGWDTVKILPRDSVIVYKESKDLLDQMDAFLSV